MAIRALHSRFASSFLGYTRCTETHLHKDLSREFLPSLSSLSSRFDLPRRGVKTIGEDSRSLDSASLKPSSDSDDVASSSSALRFSAEQRLRASARHDLAMMFTCRVCETRSVKTVCKESYEKGVVVVRCGGCENLHLIADRLGWFGEPNSVEDFLAARGEDVRKGLADSLSLTLEDFLPNKPH